MVECCWDEEFIVHSLVMITIRLPLEFLLHIFFFRGKHLVIAHAD